MTETHDRDPVCLFSPTTALKSPDKSVQAYRLATRDIASTYLTLGLTEVGETGFLAVTVASTLPQAICVCIWK